MLSTIVENPEGTFVTVLLVITAWPYVIKSWNDWRKEQFLRNHPSVIFVSKPSQQHDVWPTRLAKFVYRNAQNWIVLSCRVILSFVASILRTLTIWFTSKPSPAPETKPGVSLPHPEPTPVAASPQAVATRVLPPTSVLKRRGERRRSMEPRVTFTESANGKVATSYYYYNPSQQSNQKPTMNAQQTSVAAQRVPRLSTPYPLAKQPPPTTTNGEKPNAFPTLDKENLPKLSSYKNHSPGQRQMRAAMAPVTSALRKRRIELENLANHASEKKRRIPIGTHSTVSLMVNPNKRRERQLLVWEHLNKKPKKEELLLKDDALTASQRNHHDTVTQLAPTENALSASFAPTAVVDSTLPLSQNNALPNGATEESKADSGFQSGTAYESSQSSSTFQFGSTANAPVRTSTVAPSSFTEAMSPSKSAALSNGPKQSTPTSGLEFGASTTSESTASSTTPFGSTASTSNGEKADTNGVQFGSNGFFMNRKEEPVSANSSFQFGSSEPTPPTETATYAVIAPTFAFGSTKSAPSATETPSTSSLSFGNPLQSSTSTPAFQPAFQFGSSAERTLAPGPVSNGIVIASVDPQANQSNAAFQVGGSNATASFGNNADPTLDASSLSAPSFGAPGFGMGYPTAPANNSARTRRLARRGRRIA
jgi:hypothetical protein